MPPAEGKTSVHLRVDTDVLDWFKAQGRGHLTRMNAVLREGNTGLNIAAGVAALTLTYQPG